MNKKIQTIIIISLLIISTNFIVNTTANNPFKNQSLASLAYEPKSHDFGDMIKGEINSTFFEIWNSGCCYLDYDLSSEEEWLEVDPTEGGSTGEHDVITVTANTTNLGFGPHESSIYIDANVGDGNFTVTVNVISDKILDITVQEAWDLLNNVSNGIQIPIDVRYDHEWVAAHIDTSYPENPKHHCKCAWEDPIILQDFLDLYDGKEIILYSNNGIRSTEAANTLVTHNFNGFVYNMVDGFDAWIQAGYPTKANSPPNIPVISGESKVKAGQEYQYTFNATDIDEDMIYYFINWNDDTNDQLVGPCPSGEAIIVSHIWPETQTTYSLQAKSRDVYNSESDWATLEVKTPKTSYTIFYQLLLRLFEKINIFFHL